MSRVLFAAIVAAIVFAAPAAARSTPTLHGVVIARLAGQGEIVVAPTHGPATTVRAASLPAPGAVIQMGGFKLSDGTFAARQLRVTGHVRRARFQGVLVRKVGSVAFFAAGRSVVAVRTGNRSLASTTDDLSPGETAEIDVTIVVGGHLDEDGVTPEPGAGDSNEVVLQVTTAAVTPATTTTPGSLTLTIDGQTLVIPLPAGTALPSSFVANAIVAVQIQFRQRGEDNDEDDDQPAGTTTTTTTITTGPPSTTTTTTTVVTSGQSGHGDGGGGGGGDGSSGGPGPSGNDGGGGSGRD